MYEDDHSRSDYRSDGPRSRSTESWSDRIKLWLETKMNNVGDTLISLIVPVIQFLILLGVISVISIAVNIYLHRTMVPRALIHEKIYFDYVSENPTASINLNHAIKQWNYIKNEVLPSEATPPRRFLKVGYYYDIHCVFTIAKSSRNYDIGATAITLNVVDTTNDIIAKSIRTIVIPYQHPMTLLLESIVYFPWRSMKYTDQNIGETVDVWVSLMSEYQEPIAMFPPANALNLSLSVPIMDISSAYITVMPKLTGIVYYMYYRPVLTFILGCVLVSTIQFFVFGTIAVVVLVLRYAVRNISNNRSQDPLSAQYTQYRRRRASAYTSSANQYDTERRVYQLQESIDRMEHEYPGGEKPVLSVQEQTSRYRGSSNINNRNGSSNSGGAGTVVYTHSDTGRRSQVSGLNSPEALRTRSISEEENKTQHISPHTLGVNNMPDRDRTNSSSSNRQHPQSQLEEDGQLHSRDHGNATVPRQSILPRNGIPELETSYSQQSPHSIHNSSTNNSSTSSSSANNSSTSSSSANNSQVTESDDEQHTTTTTPTAAEAEAELDRVFQNDYFNSFFSFLQRKPSTSVRQEEEESDRNSKKTR